MQNHFNENKSVCNSVSRSYSTNIKKLFPKAKKLKLPDMEEMDMKEISYLSWIDKGSSRKFIIAKMIKINLLVCKERSKV